MSINARCRLCGCNENRPAATLKNMPRWNHRLLQSSELKGDRPLDLVIHRCGSCGFVNLPSALADDYYDDYVNSTSSSPQIQKFLNEQAVEFVTHFSLSGRSVLEIGCGDGGFLQSMASAGANCVGIEPSRAQRELALAKGLRVEGGLLTADRCIEGDPFDAFATRQVLEHIEDMHGFLAAVRSHLKPGGAGLVEVPNLGVLLEQERFFDFIPEHLNYFSERTLRLILELAGFDVLSVDPVQNGEALRALIRRREEPPLTGLHLRIERLSQDLSSFVKHHHDRGERVAIWGAGGKGLSMLAAAGLGDVDLLVDGDSHKHGRYTPVSHLQVSPPSTLGKQSFAAVIILAPAYAREILCTLREQYAFKGRVGIVNGGAFEIMES